MARQVLIEKSSNTTRITMWDSTTPDDKTIISADYILKYNPKKDLLQLYPRETGVSLPLLKMVFSELTEVYGTSDLEGFTNYLIDNDFFNSASGGSGAEEKVVADVSVTYDIDWASPNAMFVLTMTANTTFSDINLPSEPNSKVIEIILNGNYTATLPAYWEALPSNDSYLGTVRNHIVVSCVDGTTSSEDVLYSLENLSA
jgi:hypothetical protein